MTSVRMIELAAALVILGAGLFFHIRRDKADAYGSQGAVILFVVAAIMGVHALGALDYHPTDDEIAAMKARAR